MCIFCSIIQREIPSNIIYEDDNILIVNKPKGLCDTDVFKHVMEVAQMLSKRIMERTQAKGMNILSNVNEVAGQTVMHFHVHLIPRYSEDDACVIEFKESEKQNLEELAELLK